jgi:hypothetical protein
MTLARPHHKENEMTHLENDQNQWSYIYKIGGVAAIGAVLVGVIEIIITFLPGGSPTRKTVVDWFMLFQSNWFMGLRDLGLLNMFLNTLAILTYFALYAAHRQDRYQPFAMLAMIIAFLGIGIFFATNRAFPMLALSQQYAAATTDEQRALLEAAGQSMLSVGQSHTPGTFLSFFFLETAAIFISIVMLYSEVFSKATAYAGIFGFGMLLIFEFLSSFVTGLSVTTMALAMFGGLLSMAWYILIARRLFQLRQNSVAYP